MTGIKKINLISAVLVSLSLCGGCTLEKAGNSSQDQTVQEDNETEQVKAEKAEKEEINEMHLRDKDSLYENADDTSVVTMYLTVSKGNSSENTYHTWKEINSYSVYDYEDMGVERYQVAGLLQVGDENGPIEGEVGYGESVPNATVQIRGQTSSQNAQKNYISVCPTMRLRQMQARMLSAILSFCRSVTALRTSNLHGCSLARPRTALPSTSISWTTRR